MHDNKIEDKYRSLVLGHLIIQARKNRTSIAKLPPEELERLGVGIVKEGTVTKFEVRMPECMNGNLQKIMGELEAEIRRNSSIFPETPKRKRKEGLTSWTKRPGRPKKQLDEMPIAEDIARLDD